MKVNVMSLIMCVGLCLSANNAMATQEPDKEDALYLCGTVLDKDLNASTVTIKVKTQGCKGERLFKTPAANLSDFVIGAEKCFSIDSSHCMRDHTYNIVVDENENQTHNNLLITPQKNSSK